MKLRLLLVSIAAAAAVVPAALASGNSITANPAAPTTATGVFFAVTVGGNHDSAEVGVDCDSGYATRLTVALDASGAGTSRTIYPPAGNCTATLELGKQIGRFHVLATTAFTVT